MKLSNIKNLYDMINRDTFNSVLTRPTILLTRNKRHDGWYIFDGAITINPDQNIAQMVDTVYHEMIHQFIQEILQIEEKDAHGPIFKQMYEDLRK